jgi:hypothetical protein
MIQERETYFGNHIQIFITRYSVEGGPKHEIVSFLACPFADSLISYGKRTTPWQIKNTERRSLYFKGD